MSDDEPRRLDLAAFQIPRPDLPPPDVRRSVLDGDYADDVADADERLAQRRLDDALPPRFRHATLDDLVEPARGDLETWASADEPSNLVLLGPVGVGKTHAAVAACRAAVIAGRSIWFAPIGELLDELDWRRTTSAATLERACTVDLLVLDDLGAERSNEWTGERLYLVINRRWLERRPTVVTSNMTTDQLVGAVGERTYSRLAHDALAILLTGKDQRRG